MRGHSLSARSLRGPSPPFGNHFRVLASPPFQAQELHTQMLCTQLPEQGSFQGLPLASWKSRGHFPPDMVICSNAAPPHTHTHTHTHTHSIRCSCWWVTSLGPCAVSQPHPSISFFSSMQFSPDEKAPDETLLKRLRSSAHQKSVPLPEGFLAIDFPLSASFIYIPTPPART